MFTDFLGGFLGALGGVVAGVLALKGLSKWGHAFVLRSFGIILAQVLVSE